MTRKRAISIVVFNVKKGWTPKRWREVWVSVNRRPIHDYTLQLHFSNNAPLLIPFRLRGGT